MNDKVITASPAAHNPANDAPKAPQRRIPLALPTLKLEVPEIPGYKLRWFRGNPQRIQQAMNAGYAFVERGEVEINHQGLANDYESDGNSDLGSRVSVSAGQDIVDGGATRLYLMKIPLEFWAQDAQLVADRQEQVAGRLRGDKGFSEAGQDTTNRYSRGESRNMFIPRRS